ncbi:uncharacterized protein LOC129768137 [Toxorhynchites rutilus septentrionalis]|uniref:uncharacterized protein LOC129768137 n=1 Tax=Toxorhynchites rutilus septentrionalis TaxID=329112 RepID=UPI00247AEED4|nr:uncharacterized protein LOC129768137 [Toxorhynchites rutilus septentrionalis]
MWLLRAVLVAIFIAGSEVLAMPTVNCCNDRDLDLDQIDPLKSEDSYSADVRRMKRKQRAEHLIATNSIYFQDPLHSRTTKPRTSEKKARQASDDEALSENAVSFDPEDKIMLKLPGKLFGSASSLVLTVARMVGDLIMNSAIRSARFLQLFQPLFGQSLYIQIPTPTPVETNEI